MISELLNSGALNITYTAVLGISFLFAVLSLLGAELGDALDFDVDVEADGFDFINISPFALAMFGSIFGLTGLVTRTMLGMGTVGSLLWATLFGTIVGVGAQAFFITVLAPSRSSHISIEEDGEGRTADVTTTIPASGKGVIAFENRSGRVQLGARSVNGEPISTGETVVIEKVAGRVAFVRPADLDTAELKSAEIKKLESKQ
jgi:membrane protein implicated in regulation of membrane protease activity